MKKQDAINGGKLRLRLERGAPVLHGQRFQRTGFLWGHLCLPFSVLITTEVHQHTSAPMAGTRH